MRVRGRLLLVGLALAAALVSAGCGDGDDGGFWGAPSVVCVVDGRNVNLSFMTLGFYLAGIDTTAVSGTNTMESVYIYFPGSGPGSWTSPGGGGMIIYEDAAGDSYLANDTVGSYTVTVTAYGPVDGRIEGTFSATVEDTLGSNSHTISGSFSVVRWADM